MFSVLRGKGGNRDNPNAKDFREALRAAVVEAILLQSDSSNCAEDVDRFLLTLTAFSKHTSIAVQSSPVPEPAAEPAQAEVDPETQLTWLIANPYPPSANPFLVSCEVSVLFYEAGYIARKVCEQVCEECQALLTDSLSGAEHELFLKKKQYSELKGQGLIVQSEELFIVIKHLEESYLKRIKMYVHLTNVRANLLRGMEKDLGQSKLCCPHIGHAEACKLQSLVLGLFVNVRFHSTQKENSSLFSAPSAKRNRKMLTLTHL